MIEVSLIRHGETEYNRAFRLQGSLDSPLTEQGRDQALSLGRRMAAQSNYAKIDAWFCSPQGRARETSRLIRSALTDGLVPEMQLDDRIREIHCGKLEGHIMHEVDPEILLQLRNDTGFAYPGGESIDDVIVRASSFWNDLWPRLEAAGDENGRDYRVVIVSHGNFLRCLASVMIEMPATYAVRAVLENTGVCLFRSLHEGAALKMVRWNDRSHLVSESD